MYITEQTSSLISRDQITVVLTQALAALTKTFLVKPQFEGSNEPVPRMAYCGLDTEVDFWIVYEGIIILLSFSNEVASITSSRIGKKTTDNWNTLNEKVDKVKYTGKLKDSNDYQIYKVALDMVTFTKKVRSIEAYVGDYSLSAWKKRFYRELAPTPSWSSCWKLNSELAGPYEYTDTIEAYPAVAFLAHMKPIHDESKVYKGERLDVLAKVDNKKLRNRVAGDWVYWAYQKVSVENPEIISDW
ncbi:MAG: hypothetical protein BWY74_02185 [Firmicutes bacterium ADurb.Bin419]|nr:MAG: hypothetical protein BWY74_02185 [Firmicutes bacterium ADurb.Bin419]